MKEKKKLSLPAWIFIGMLAGIVAGLIFAFAGLGDFTTEWIKPIGTIYVNLLKFLVVPVVLFSIADGVISLKDLKRVGSVGAEDLRVLHDHDRAGRRHRPRCWSTSSRATSPRCPPQTSARWSTRPRKPRPSCRSS